MRQNHPEKEEGDRSLDDRPYGLRKNIVPQSCSHFRINERFILAYLSECMRIVSTSKFILILFEASSQDYAYYLKDPECFFVQDILDYDENTDLKEEYPAYYTGFIATATNTMALSALLDDEYIIDSGCIGGHILKSKELVRQLVKPRYDVQVSGFTGDSTRPTHVGVLLDTDQRVFIMPTSVVNLLSLRELVGEHGSYVGDEHSLKIFDGSKNLILTATTKANGLLIVSKAQLLQAFTHPKALVIHIDDSSYSTEEKSRAWEAWNLCPLLGHPGDAQITKMLSSGGYRYTHLTAKDFQLGRKLHGHCDACREGKMVSTPPSISPSSPPTFIGEKVHADLIELRTPSVGNTKQLLVSVDEKTGFKAISKMEGKSLVHLKQGFTDLLTTYNENRHAIKTIITDDEAVLKAARELLAFRGVRISQTPASFHERTVERAIRHIKSVCASILAYLSYEWPANLQSEALSAAVRSINNAPNSHTGNRSAYEVFTGDKPFIPRFYFGQIGLFHHIHAHNGLRKTAELGIFLNYGVNERYLRAYLPDRMRIVSMSKFVPVLNQVPPKQWNFIMRTKPVPISQPVELLHFEPEPDTSNPYMNQPVAPPLHEPVIPPIIEPAIQPVPSIQPTNEPVIQPVIHPTVPIEHTLPPAVPASLPTVPIPVPTHVEGVDALDSPIDPTTVNSPPHASDSPVGHPAPPDPPTRQEGVVFPPADMVTPRRSDRLAARPSRTWDPAEVGTGGQNKVRSKNTKSQVNNATVFVVVFEDCSALQVSLKKALQDKTRAPQIIKAVGLEIDNMEKPGVMSAMKYEDIPKEYRKDIIGVWLVYKPKYKSDGSFDKDKARIVTLSQYRDPATIGETFAPTVNPLSLMTQIQEAATNPEIWMCSYDIRHAFLMTPIKPPKRYFIKVAPDLVKYWIHFYPERKAFLHTDGHLYFELKVYLYGLQESPHHFNAMFDEDLKKLGFRPTTGDKCFYVLFTKDGWIKISTHVDDQFVTGYGKKLKNWFETELKKKYEFTIQEDENGISHLGMMIKRTSQGITVVQQGYIQNLLKKYRESNSTKYPSTPANDNLMRDVDSPEFSRNKYLSVVMSLLFLARFTRHDILFPTTYLATKSGSPTEYHYDMCQHVLNYLAGTTDVGIVYSKNANMIPVIYADSSHILHSDGKGHGGIVITLGSAPILVKSFKLRLVTRSTSESELVSLEEAVSYGMYLKTFLSELRLWKLTNPISVYQDNLSTIRIATTGPSFKRSRHLLAKEAYVQQYVESNDVQLKYLRSEDMVADMMTKPLSRMELSHQMYLLFIKRLR